MFFKRSAFFLFPFLLFSVLAAQPSHEAEAADSEILTVYCYDSFASDWGPGPALARQFEAETGMAVEFIAPGDAADVLSRVILEKASPSGDILIGPDNNLLARVIEEEILEPYESPELRYVDKTLQFDATHSLTPFDYGYFAICYDSEVITDPPHSLSDLTDPRFAGKLAIMDPRTSSPGLGFLLWTIAAFGDETAAYWESLQPSILTVTGGWSEAYGLFTTGEAPLVLSYSTSPVYHVEYEESTRYRTALFSDGLYAQIEGLGIIRGTSKRAAAERFIDFILSPEAQQTIAVANIMFPVRGEVELPASFEYGLKPEKTLSLPAETIEAERDDWIEAWVGFMSR